MNSNGNASSNGPPTGDHSSIQQPDIGARSLALSEKVRSLRLSDKIAKSSGGGASSGMMWFLFLLVVVLAGVVGYNAYSTQSTLKRLDELDKKAATAAKKAEDDKIEGNDTITDPGERKEDIALQYKGFVVPISQILVSPEVGGKVVWLKFKEGQNVKKGDILAKIEEIKYKAEFDKAEAVVDGAVARWNVLWKYREDEVKQLKTELDEALATREQTLAEYVRSKSLQLSRSVAARDYEEAESKHRSAVARVKRIELSYELLQKGPRDEQIAAAKAEVDAAKAQLVNAKKSLDDTVIRAPVTGTILTKKAEENNQVNPSAFSNGLSASLCEMADLTELEIDVSIVERDRSRVKENQECRIRVDSWPGKVYEGYVSRIMPQADRSKNAIPVRVKVVRAQLAQDLNEGGPFLLPEMSAVVTFLNSQVDPKSYGK